MAITFLHLSDIHLDTPFKSIYTKNPVLKTQMQQATKQSFENLVTVAIEQHVDFVVIVGDSFNRIKPSVKSQVFFRMQLDRLAQEDIPVYLCFGNHDYGGELLIEFPHNTYVFGEQVETAVLSTKHGERVSFHGFSYTTPQLTTRIIQQYPKKEKTSDYAIGLLHGEYETTQTNGRYAPFTVSELNEKQYDYWALGHIHKRQVIQEYPPIIYSGNSQGLYRDETGEKGGVLVTLSKEKMPEITFVNTAPIQWQHVDFMVNEEDTLQTLLNRWAMERSENDTGEFYLVTVNWLVHPKVEDTLLTILDSGELRELHD